MVEVPLGIVIPLLVLASLGAVVVVYHIARAAVSDELEERGLGKRKTK